LTDKYLRGVVIDEVINGYHYDWPAKEKNLTFHHDHLNSVTAVTGHDGTTVETASYGPFGNMISETGPALNGGEVANKLRYTGREFDRETGLYYYRARYYDPELGRFYTEDPLGFHAGINFYAYVNNNPLNANDPTGLFEFDISFEQNMANAMNDAVDDLGYGGFDFDDISSGLDIQFELDQSLQDAMKTAITDMQQQATADMISSGFQSYSGLAGNQEQNSSQDSYNISDSFYATRVAASNFLMKSLKSLIAPLVTPQGPYEMSGKIVGAGLGTLGGLVLGAGHPVASGILSIGGAYYFGKKGGAFGKQFDDPDAGLLNAPEINIFYQK